jgi:hypothetical protein
MARTTINTQVIPDGTIVSADLSYPLTDFSSTGIDDNATSNALTIDSSQDVTFSSHALFPDNSRARFGAGLDLQIYHDGSNSYIDESSGVGNLIVKGANVLLQNTTGENYLTLTTNGAATLYYDNAAKLATTSTGIDVTGDVNSDSVTTGTFTSTGIDDNATSTAITIDSSENVGIGTTNPSSDAIVKFLAIDDATSSGLVLEGARKFSMYSSSSSTLSFRDETAGANRITLDSSGNVGIGTATPNSAGLGYNGQTLQLGERTFIATDSSGDTRLGGLSGSNITAFYQGGSERMRIDSSGSLVIGATTSNNRKLSVNGTGDLVELRSTNSGAAGAQLDLIHNSASPADGDSVGIINFSNVTTQMANVTGKSSSVSSSYGELHFGTRNGGTYGFSNMIIDRLGNLLVGKASTDYGNSTRKEFNLYGTNEAIITLDTGNALPFYLNNNNGGADIWNQNNNYMRFGTNSTERMRIDSSGKIGIGTTSPSGSFHLTTVDAGGSDVFYVAQNTTANRIAGYRILDENNSIGGIFQYDNGGNNLLIGTTLASNFQFITSNTERMRIDSSGSVLFGKTTSTLATSGGMIIAGNSITMTIASGTTYHLHDGSNYKFYVNANGGIYNYSGNNVNLSDQRAKKDIVDSGNYLEKLCNIPVRNFRYNEDAEDSKHHLGVIAQEVEAVAPEFVSKASWEHKDGPMDTVYNTDLMFAMMKSIQELSAQVTELKAEVAALKGA